VVLFIFFWRFNLKLRAKDVDIERLRFKCNEMNIKFTETTKIIDEKNEELDRQHVKRMYCEINVLKNERLARKYLVK